MVRAPCELDGEALGEKLKEGVIARIPLPVREQHEAPRARALDEGVVEQAVYVWGIDHVGGEDKMVRDCEQRGYVAPIEPADLEGDRVL